MFKMNGGHINPQFVESVDDITHLSTSSTDTNEEILEEFSYEVTLTSGAKWSSEKFRSYDEAVKNRGILIRMLSPNKRQNGKQHLQEDK